MEKNLWDRTTFNCSGLSVFHIGRNVPGPLLADGLTLAGGMLRLGEERRGITGGSASGGGLVSSSLKIPDHLGVYLFVLLYVEL